jgi:thiamine-monophosphate kinase
LTGEFEVVAALAETLPRPTDPRQVWIGDDAAVLPTPSGGRLLLATDAVVAGVHADLSLTGLDDLGWKALAAAVSDIAAMGGDPGHAVVAVAAPAGTDMAALYEGIAASAAAHRCPVVGGDLVSSTALVVAVTVTGFCEDEPVLRRGARPGDGVWVTRPLGAAAAGLRSYLAAGADEAAGPGDADNRRAHARPRAELDAGRAARQAGATAMIDISDGLAADLGHLVDASGVGIRLESVPVAAGATVDDALGGGEDFALAFCAGDAARVAAAFAGLRAPLLVGTCTDAGGELTLAGVSLNRAGWEHRW